MDDKTNEDRREEAERDLLIMSTWLTQRIEAWQWRMMTDLLASTPPSADRDHA